MTAAMHLLLLLLAALASVCARTCTTGLDDFRDKTIILQEHSPSALLSNPGECIDYDVVYTADTSQTQMIVGATLEITGADYISWFDGVPYNADQTNGVNQLLVDVITNDNTTMSDFDMLNGTAFVVFEYMNGSYTGPYCPLFPPPALCFLNNTVDLGSFPTRCNLACGLNVVKPCLLGRFVCYVPILLPGNYTAAVKITPSVVNTPVYLAGLYWYGVNPFNDMPNFPMPQYINPLMGCSDGTAIDVFGCTDITASESLSPPSNSQSQSVSHRSHSHSDSHSKSHHSESNSPSASTSFPCGPYASNDFVKPTSDLVLGNARDPFSLCAPANVNAIYPQPLSDPIYITGYVQNVNGSVDGFAELFIWDPFIPFNLSVPNQLLLTVTVLYNTSIVIDPLVDIFVGRSLVHNSTLPRCPNDVDFVQCGLMSTGPAGCSVPTCSGPNGCLQATYLCGYYNIPDLASTYNMTIAAYYLRNDTAPTDVLAIIDMEVLGAPVYAFNELSAACTQSYDLAPICPGTCTPFVRNLGSLPIFASPEYHNQSICPIADTVTDPDAEQSLVLTGLLNVVGFNVTDGYEVMYTFWDPSDLLVSTTPLVDMSVVVLLDNLNISGMPFLSVELSLSNLGLMCPYAVGLTYIQCAGSFGALFPPGDFPYSPSCGMNSSTYIGIAFFTCEFAIPPVGVYDATLNVTFAQMFNTVSHSSVVLTPPGEFNVDVLPSNGCEPQYIYPECGPATPSASPSATPSMSLSPVPTPLPPPPAECAPNITAQINYFTSGFITDVGGISKDFDLFDDGFMVRRGGGARRPHTPSDGKRKGVRGRAAPLPRRESYYGDSDNITTYDNATAFLDVFWGPSDMQTLYQYEFLPPATDPLTYAFTLSEQSNCGVHIHVLGCNPNIQLILRPNAFGFMALPPGPPGPTMTHSQPQSMSESQSQSQPSHSQTQPSPSQSQVPMTASLSESYPASCDFCASHLGYFMALTYPLSCPSGSISRITDAVLGVAVNGSGCSIVTSMACDNSTAFLEYVERTCLGLTSCTLDPHSIFIAPACAGMTQSSVHFTCCGPTHSESQSPSFSRSPSHSGSHSLSGSTSHESPIQQSQSESYLHKLTPPCVQGFYLAFSCFVLTKFDQTYARVFPLTPNVAAGAGGVGAQSLNTVKFFTWVDSDCFFNLSNTTHGYGYGIEIAKPDDSPDDGFYLRCDKGEELSGNYTQLYAGTAYCQSNNSADGVNASMVGTYHWDTQSVNDTYWLFAPNATEAGRERNFHFFGTPRCPHQSLCPSNGWFFNQEYRFVADYLGPAYAFPAFPLAQTVQGGVDPFMVEFSYVANQPEFLALFDAVNFTFGFEISTLFVFQIETGDIHNISMFVPRIESTIPFPNSTTCYRRQCEPASSYGYFDKISVLEGLESAADGNQVTRDDVSHLKYSFDFTGCLEGALMDLIVANPLLTPLEALQQMQFVYTFQFDTGASVYNEPYYADAPPYTILERLLIHAIGYTVDSNVSSPGGPSPTLQTKIYTPKDSCLRDYVHEPLPCLECNPNVTVDALFRGTDLSVFEYPSCHAFMANTSTLFYRVSTISNHFEPVVGVQIDFESLGVTDPPAWIYNVDMYVLSNATFRSNININAEPILVVAINACDQIPVINRFTCTELPMDEICASVNDDMFNPATPGALHLFDCTIFFGLEPSYAPPPRNDPIYATAFGIVFPNVMPTDVILIQQMTIHVTDMFNVDVPGSPRYIIPQPCTPEVGECDCLDCAHVAPLRFAPPGGVDVMRVDGETGAGLSYFTGPVIIDNANMTDYFTYTTTSNRIPTYSYGDYTPVLVRKKKRSAPTSVDAVEDQPITLDRLYPDSQTMAPYNSNLFGFNYNEVGAYIAAENNCGFYFHVKNCSSSVQVWMRVNGTEVEKAMFGTGRKTRRARTVTPPVTMNIVDQCTIVVDKQFSTPIQYDFQIIPLTPNVLVSHFGTQQDEVVADYSHDTYYDYESPEAKVTQGIAYVRLLPVIDAVQLEDILAMEYPFNDPYMYGFEIQHVGSSPQSGVYLNCELFFVGPSTNLGRDLNFLQTPGTGFPLFADKPVCTSVAMSPDNDPVYNQLAMTVSDVFTNATSVPGPYGDYKYDYYTYTTTRANAEPSMHFFFAAEPCNWYPLCSDEGWHVEEQYVFTSDYVGGAAVFPAAPVFPTTKLPITASFSFDMNQQPMLDLISTATNVDYMKLRIYVAAGVQAIKPHNNNQNDGHLSFAKYFTFTWNYTGCDSLQAFQCTDLNDGLITWQQTSVLGDGKFTALQPYRDHYTIDVNITNCLLKSGVLSEPDEPLFQTQIHNLTLFIDFAIPENHTRFSTNPFGSLIYNDVLFEGFEFYLAGRVGHSLYDYDDINLSPLYGDYDGVNSMVRGTRALYYLPREECKAGPRAPHECPEQTQSFTKSPPPEQTQSNAETASRSATLSQRQTNSLSTSHRSVSNSNSQSMSDSKSHRSQSRSHHSRSARHTQSKSPSPATEDCCDRNHVSGQVRHEDTVCGAGIGGGGGARRRAPLGGPFPGGVSVSSVSDIAEYLESVSHENLYSCDPLDGPLDILPGGVYQVKDHLFPYIGPSTFLADALPRLGLRVGLLWLTFDDPFTKYAETMVKFSYTPGQSLVVLKGTALGRMHTGFCYEPVLNHKLWPQEYEIEITITNGLVPINGAGSDLVMFITRASNATGWVQPMFCNGVGGCPKLFFSVADLSSLVVPPDLMPLVQTFSPVQFLVGVDFPGVFPGIYTGMGALQVDCAGAIKVENITVGTPLNVTLLSYACAPFFSQTDLTCQGLGLFMFDVESVCNDCAPTPSPGICAFHNVSHESPGQPGPGDYESPTPRGHGGGRRLEPAAAAAVAVDTAVAPLAKAKPTETPSTRRGFIAVLILSACGLIAGIVIVTYQVTLYWNTNRVEVYRDVVARESDTGARRGILKQGAHVLMMSDAAALGTDVPTIGVAGSGSRRAKRLPNGRVKVNAHESDWAETDDEGRGDATDAEDAELEEAVLQAAAPEQPQAGRADLGDGPI